MVAQENVTKSFIPPKYMFFNITRCKNSDLTACPQTLENLTKAVTRLNHLPIRHLIWEQQLSPINY